MENQDIETKIDETTRPPDDVESVNSFLKQKLREDDDDAHLQIPDDVEFVSDLSEPIETPGLSGEDPEPHNELSDYQQHENYANEVTLTTLEKAKKG